MGQAEHRLILNEAISRLIFSCPQKDARVSCMGFEGCTSCSRAWPCKPVLGQLLNSSAFEFSFFSNQRLNRVVGRLVFSQAPASRFLPAVSWSKQNARHQRTPLWRCLGFDDIGFTIPKLAAPTLFPFDHHKINLVSKLGRLFCSTFRTVEASSKI